MTKERTFPIPIPSSTFYPAFTFPSTLVWSDFRKKKSQTFELISRLRQLIMCLNVSNCKYLMWFASTQINFVIACETFSNFRVVFLLIECMKETDQLRYVRKSLFFFSWELIRQEQMNKKFPFHMFSSALALSFSLFIHLSWTVTGARNSFSIRECRIWNNDKTWVQIYWILFLELQQQQQQQNVQTHGGAREITERDNPIEFVYVFPFFILSFLFEIINWFWIVEK